MLFLYLTFGERAELFLNICGLLDSHFLAVGLLGMPAEIVVIVVDVEAAENFLLLVYLFL